MEILGAEALLRWFHPIHGPIPPPVIIDRLEAGTDGTPSGPFSDTIDVEGSDADGTYTSDWVFDEGTGNLDSCNGTIDGEYVYLVTDEYPYVSGCLNGDVSGVSGVGGGQGAAQHLALLAVATTLAGVFQR